MGERKSDDGIRLGVFAGPFHSLSVASEIKLGHYQLADSLDALIDRVRDEYDMSYASVVGVLQMKIHTLLHEAEDEAEDRDE